MVLNYISKLEDRIEEIEMNTKLNNNNNNDNLNVSNNEESEELTPVKENDDVISTAIIFKTQSSPLLLPQTEITISVEKIVKEKETGIIKFYIKAFTNETDSYSALEPGNLFEIINPDGKNHKALKVEGSFDSIPPQSSKDGAIIFKLNENQNNFVISIDSKDEKKYYEFNFETNEYKEAVLG
jgi:hypothetical protein